MSTSYSEHGVLVCVYQTGLLIIGASGIGKSELALALIKNGHQLIADDSVLITEENGTVYGRCPQLLQDFLEVRGLGIINIRKLFGDNRIVQSTSIDMVVELKDVNDVDVSNRLYGHYSEKKFYTKTVPTITIPLKLGRDLTALVETAVLNQQLRDQGYFAEQDFITKQASLL